MSENTTMDKLVAFVDTIAGPLAKFGQLPFVASLVNGMIGALPVTMVGSLFLVVFLFAAPGNLTAEPLLPFLTPFAGQLALVNSLSMGMMAVYIAIAFGGEYAATKGIDKTTGAIGTFFGFILLNYNAVGSLAEIAEDGAVAAGGSALAIGNWGAAGIITTMVAGAIAVNLINLCYKKNIVIKLPDSVPPAIANSFSAIIPYFMITIICWGIRTICNIDIPALINNMLLPVLSAADNVFIYAIQQLFSSLLWCVGLHGDNITGAVINTFTNTWMIENNNAFMAGTTVANLPYTWTPNLCRLGQWVSSCWPILVYMYMSSKKLPHLKTLANIALPSAVFCIVEPIMFGLPVVLNPYLLIPFVLSHTVCAFTTYLATAWGFVGKMYISLPWATPSPILGYLGSGGSIGGIIIVIINFLIGLVIFYPFWKSYEKAEVAKMEAGVAE